MKRYRNEEGTPLFSSVGSSTNEAVPPPGEYVVRVEWRVEGAMRVTELDSKRPYNIYVKESLIEGDIFKGCLAELTVGLTDGVVVFHNGGMWSAKEVGANAKVLLDGVAFAEVVNLFNQGHVPAIPIVKKMKRRNE